MVMHDGPTEVPVERRVRAAQVTAHNPVTGGQSTGSAHTQPVLQFGLPERSLRKVKTLADSSPVAGWLRPHS